MLPGYDIMSQRLPSVTEAEASVQCLVSRGSLHSPGQRQCPQVQLIGHNDTVTRSCQQCCNFLECKRRLGLIDCGESLQYN